MVMRFGTSMPRSRVPAPLCSSASSNSGWVVMPAPRPTSSTGERSNTSTSQPIRRRNAAVNSPDMEPPTMTARRPRRRDEAVMRPPAGLCLDTLAVPSRRSQPVGTWNSPHWCPVPKLLGGHRGRGYERAIMRRPIRILGIDPGLRRTGWGVVTIEGNRLSFVACGSLASDERADLAVRLLSIHDGLQRVVAEHVPDEAAVEATFVNKDATATLKLGQARGIAMLVPAIAGLRVAEYAPNLVKKTIVGAGHCEKAQIRMMIGVLLPKADPKSHDAADALAIAVTHAHHRQSAVLKVAAR